MKKITSLLTLLFCVFWYSTCFAGAEAGDNQPVNNAIPKQVVLTAKANTANPTWTSGTRVPLSVDTSGYLRVTGSISGRTLTSSSTFINQTTATTTKIITGNAGQIKAYAYSSAATTASATSVQIRFVYGTGINCATGTTSISGFKWYSGNNSLIQPMGSIPYFIVPINNDLCVQIINIGAASSVDTEVTYIQE